MDSGWRSGVARGDFCLSLTVSQCTTTVAVMAKHPSMIESSKVLSCLATCQQPWQCLLSIFFFSSAVHLHTHVSLDPRCLTDVRQEKPTVGSGLGLDDSIRASKREWTIEKESLLSHQMHCLAWSETHPSLHTVCSIVCTPMTPLSSSEGSSLDRVEKIDFLNKRLMPRSRTYIPNLQPFNVESRPDGQIHSIRLYPFRASVQEHMRVQRPVPLPARKPHFMRLYQTSITPRDTHFTLIAIDNTRNYQELATASASRMNSLRPYLTGVTVSPSTALIFQAFPFQFCQAKKRKRENRKAMGFSLAPRK
jgi:hypothetical protein